MAFKAGTAAKLYLGNAAGALQDVSAYADNISWPQSVQSLEVSVFGTQAKAFLPGLTDGDTFTVSGPLDPTMWTQLTGLKNAGSITPIQYGPMGSVTAFPRMAGSCFVTQVQPSTGVGGRVEYTASLQITGAVTNGTY